MARVEITSLAEEDLYQIWHFIAIRRHNPENAERFIDELTEQFYGLANIPEIGTRKRNLHTNLYQFPFRSYLIFIESSQTASI